MLFMFIFILAVYAIHAFLLGRVFKKAGIEQWKAWVPVYNSWIMLEMGDQKGFWAIMMFVPILNFVALVFIIIAMYKINQKFGKEDWYIVLAILIPTVWMAILAFDKSEWKAKNRSSSTPISA